MRPTEGRLIEPAVGVEASATQFPLSGAVKVNSSGRPATSKDSRVNNSPSRPLRLKAGAADPTASPGRPLWPGAGKTCPSSRLPVCPEPASFRRAVGTKRGLSHRFHQWNFGLSVSEGGESPEVV